MTSLQNLDCEAQCLCRSVAMAPELWCRDSMLAAQLWKPENLAPLPLTPTLAT